MAKVLVAGAGGYIGVPLCKKLIERGHSLIALDRFFFGRERVDRIALSERAAVITQDLRPFYPGSLNSGKNFVEPPWAINHDRHLIRTLRGHAPNRAREKARAG